MRKALLLGAFFHLGPTTRGHGLRECPAHAQPIAGGEMTAEERIVRLERQARSYRLALFAVAAVLCALVVMGATKPSVRDEVICARGFALVNDQGNVVGLLGADSLGNGRLIVALEDQSPFFSAGATSGRGVVRVLSAAGKGLVYAGADEEGDGLLIVSSRAGEDLIYAGVDASGNGLLTVSSPAGGDLVYAGADALGNGLLTVDSKDPQGACTIGARADSLGLVIRNKEGVGVAQLGADANGHGYLGVVDGKTKGQAPASR